ncbi:hypothetical protein [Arthrobacter sp. ISL-30]|uniref:hypothetical protein n=1 Tax=Arthrobacter sp. ISL-30 TaxID=2819109 RepID=UPI002034C8C7|nr:hypothetical protein [Arthrobacter sp. ISL-30]
MNRGGDHQLNKAIYTIALIRMNRDPVTRDYVAKRTSQGRTKERDHPQPQEIHHPPDLPNIQPLRSGAPILIGDSVLLPLLPHSIPCCRLYLFSLPNIFLAPRSGSLSARPPR